MNKIDYLEYDIRENERLIKEIDQRVAKELRNKKRYLQVIKKKKKELKEVLAND